MIEMFLIGGLMDLLLAFIVFIGVMIAAIITGFSMTYALLVGLVAFLAVGMRRGFKLNDMLKMGWGGAKESLLVIEVMAVIGFITAIWRLSGTITIFVYYGIKVITPSLFLVIAYLLACLLSYALGTSFGVAGTVGVIFMALARSGGVDPILTAGVLMSGVYFGDRCSPVSSSANLVAGITGTQIFDNVKVMMKTALTPFVITLMLYIGLSIANPITTVDQDLLNTFESEFNLSLWAFVPAILMLLLPLFKVNVLKAMGLSILSGVLVSYFVQGVPLLQIFRICIFGYKATGEGLATILNGGGLMSMMEIVIILIISSSYSGIFNGTKMLESIQEKLSQGCSKVGRFSMMLLMSIGTAAIFCNQTIATLMCSDLLKKPYIDGGGSKEELAIDIENSVILIACFIPWSIGCSVPLSFFGIGPEALPYACFMYLVPLYYWFRKKKWFTDK